MSLFSFSKMLRFSLTLKNAESPKMQSHSSLPSKPQERFLNPFVLSHLQLKAEPSWDTGEHSVLRSFGTCLNCDWTYTLPRCSPDPVQCLESSVGPWPTWPVWCYHCPAPPISSLSVGDFPKRRWQMPATILPLSRISTPSPFILQTNFSCSLLTSDSFSSSCSCKEASSSYKQQRHLKVD